MRPRCGPLFLQGGRCMGLTDGQKEKIRFWRSEGLGYGAVAERLGISENTVKSFCRRNHLTGVAAKEPVVLCRWCGRPLAAVPGRKGRKFCCDGCRRAWWKAHPELVHREAYYVMVCACCGKEFKSYGNKGRKYCCHECYIKARFGKGGGHEGRSV